MIAADVRLRDELALCHKHGIPHGDFLAWPELDQDKAIAYQAFERSICKGCGTRPDEWDPAKGGDRHAYRADVIVCPGCQSTGDLGRELRGQDTEQAGQQVVLSPRAVYERQEADRVARRAARAALS